MSEDILYIGVAGTAGAGKDTASDIIARLFEARNISTSEVVRAVTRHVYDLPSDFNPVRDQLYEVANFLRNEVDPAFTVKICMLKARTAGVSYALISGLRSMGEADAIREQGGIIIGVDADPHVRYERMSARARDTESQKTFEQFLAQDMYENKGLTETGSGRGIRYIIDDADVVIQNDGSLEALEAQIQERLQPYFK
jgi:dephospho-CoA kinase